MQINTLVPESYGALPLLGQLWALDPLLVFLAALAVDYGVIRLIMLYEERQLPPRIPRQRFRSFEYNDTVVIPAFLFMAASIMQQESQPDGWYTSSWWHWTTLAGSALLSVGLELMAVRDGVFTWRQQFSPAKLYHTIIFAVMGYWMLTGMVAGFANYQQLPQLAYMIVLMGAWVWVLYVYEPRWLRAQGRKTPVNAHPEWDWRTMTPTWPDD
jgi:hypothetical protein